MSTTNYLTSRVSNQIGLASIAYGQPDYFTYVQTQVIGSHPYYDLHLSRPSMVFEGLFKQFSELRSYFASQLEGAEVWSTILKLFPRAKTPEGFFDIFLMIFLREIDNISVYEPNLPEFLTSCLSLTLRELNKERKNIDYINFGAFVRSFLDNLPTQPTTAVRRFASLFRIATDNPRTKIYDLPNNKVITLRNELRNEFNEKGLQKEFVEIPISDWENGLIYRDTSNLTTDKTVVYVTQNYSGYITEHVTSPAATNGLGTETIADATVRVEAYPPSTMVNNKLSPAEQKILEFDLINSQTGIIEI